MIHWFAAGLAAWQINGGYMSGKPSDVTLRVQMFLSCSEIVEAAASVLLQVPSLLPFVLQ